MQLVLCSDSGEKVPKSGDALLFVLSTMITVVPWGGGGGGGLYTEHYSV